jgi:hypothetical protein
VLYPWVWAWTMFQGTRHLVPVDINGLVFRTHQNSEPNPGGPPINNADNLSSSAWLYQMPSGAASVARILFFLFRYGWAEPLFNKHQAFSSKGTFALFSYKPLFFFLQKIWNLCSTELCKLVHKDISDATSQHRTVLHEIVHFIVSFRYFFRSSLPLFCADLNPWKMWCDVR